MNRVCVLLFTVWADPAGTYTRAAHSARGFILARLFLNLTVFFSFNAYMEFKYTSEKTYADRDMVLRDCCGLVSGVQAGSIEFFSAPGEDVGKKAGW